MQAHALYLTAAESEKVRRLPESLLEGWAIEEETGTAYESDDVLRIRAGMARFDTFPALRDMAKSAAAGEKIDFSTLRGMPEAALPELCFTIGARGITVLIAGLIANAKSDEDVAGIAGLSSIRRDILRTNASVTFPSSR